jgi:hypothetical protein
MESAPNDRKPTGPGKSPGEEKFVDLSLRHRRDDEEQTPECPANETGDGAEKKPGDSAPREHDEGSNPPAMITRVAQPRDAREQDQGRDDRDEEQDVIEVDQDRARRAPAIAVRCFALLSNCARSRFLLFGAGSFVHIAPCD